MHLYLSCCKLIHVNFSLHMYKNLGTYSGEMVYKIRSLLVQGGQQRIAIGHDVDLASCFDDLYQPYCRFWVKVATIKRAVRSQVNMFLP